MADISKITLPNGSQYDVKDAAIRPVFINFHSNGDHFWDEDYDSSEDNWWVFDSVTTTGDTVLTNEQFYRAYSNGAQVYLFMNSIVGGDNYYITIPLFSQMTDIESPSYELMFRAQRYSTPNSAENDTTLIVHIDTSSPYSDPFVRYIHPTSQESSHVTYSNSWSGLSADNVQDAIDEISTVAGLTDTNISLPTEGQILHYDQTNSKWVNDKTASGSFSIFPTTSEDAAIQVTGDASHPANIGVYNSLVSGTMHINMDTLGAKELVVYDSNGNRSTVVGQDASGNYFGDVFDSSNSVYDNTNSGLSATDVQDAIDEINSAIPSVSGFIDTAGTGLSKSGTTLNHSNSITAGTAGTSSATSGSTLAIPYVTYDAQGHITAKGTHTHTVTGFVATSSLPISIANGGTGQTTRLNALKALTNESVGTDADYFLTITTSWGKGGFTSVADAKTVLGLGSAAYKNSTTTLSASQTGLIQSNTVFNNLMYKPGDIIRVTGMVLTGYLTNSGRTMKFYFPVSKPISSAVSSAVLNCDNIEIRGISGYIDSSGGSILDATLIINASRNGFIWQDVDTEAHKIKGSTTNYPNNTPLTLVLYDDGSTAASIKLT